jgi:hypothetical protein
MKVFNVWITIEEIDDENDDNGQDVDTKKIARFKTFKEAVECINEFPDNTGEFTNEV